MGKVLKPDLGISVYDVIDLIADTCRNGLIDAFPGDVLQLVKFRMELRIPLSPSSQYTHQLHVLVKRKDL